MIHQLRAYEIFEHNKSAFTSASAITPRES